MGGRGASSSASNGNIANAIEHYVSGDGMWINQYLRGRGDFGNLSDFEKRFLSDLDKGTDSLVGEQTLYRSVDASAIFGDMDSMEYENLVSNVVYGTSNRFTDAAASKYLSNIKGKKITEKGFMSTTKDYKTANSWSGFTGSSKEVVLEVRTSKATRGTSVGKVSKNLEKRMGQKEVLLKRNQSYTINSVSGKDGKLYVKATMN